MTSFRTRVVALCCAVLGATATAVAPQAQALQLAAPVMGGIAASATTNLQLGNSTCTATLISPEWLLTARHCLGTGDFSRITVGSTIAGEPRVATDVIISPYADLAVVKMNAPVSARPARLGTGHLTRGQRVQIAGWGGSMALARETGAVVGQRFAAPEGSVTNPGSAYIDVSTIGGRLVRGDSGGPLFLGDEVVGVASMANTSAPLEAAGTVGWYVPVAEHLDWISRQTGIPVGPAAGAAMPLTDIVPALPGGAGGSSMSS